MEVLHISDTHTLHRQLDPHMFYLVDMVIHTGDGADSRNLKRNRDEFLVMLDWFGALPCQYKIYVPGNHDIYCMQSKMHRNDMEFKDRGIIFLREDYVKIEGISFWGSPYTPSFSKREWAYQYIRDNGENVWRDIPPNTDVLLTHGPPMYQHDFAFEDQEIIPVGCEFLYKKVLEIKPKFHLFGHVHDNIHGIRNFGVTRTKFTTYSNGACKSDGVKDFLVNSGNRLTF